MKCSDYIAEFLAKQGVTNVFTVTGGAIAHLVDSLGRRADTVGDITYTCVVHEQAGAMAAETYSRLTGNIGTAIATSGPGATNLITGICGLWFDSVPGLFITGQVNTSEATGAASAVPRQVGFQETDIVSIARPVTKYAVCVNSATDIRKILEEAVYIARSGRPGPVLVDVPVNIQTADIDPDTLEGFSVPAQTDTAQSSQIEAVVELLKGAQRPLILLGGGIRLAGKVHEARALVEMLGAPVAVSWSGFDLVPEDHPLFVGHIGVYGSRGANFTVQNCDLLISIGSRLDTRQTGGNLASFARGAKKVMVDIDRNEIEKGRGLSIDVGIVADAGDFMRALSEKIRGMELPPWSEWKARVHDWRASYRYPEEVASTSEDPMSAYPFLRKLSDALEPGDVTIADEGGNLVWTMQAFRIKEGQRLISTFGNSPMGYALPAAIGASFALPGKRIVCIDGDGGFQPNIQELQTVAHYRLPIKFFIMNNRSMGIIKQFQDLYFDERHYAAEPARDYSVPDFVKVAESYGIAAFSIRTLAEADAAIERALDTDGPILVDVRIDVDQKLTPKLEFGRPLEDMSPYLDRAELKENMMIDILPECETIPQKRGWVTM